ncbi:MAG: molecular chaperone HtpG [Betaproteobacteria bacterium]|nr:molecular chaperone HtpG [Betaproteobacteria bacterium]
MSGTKEKTSEMENGSRRETLGFQAEVKQLLHLMIHSLYSNKEIALRELISNASDACDRLRFEALDNAALTGGDGELKIHVDYDKEARTLTVSDNGIGLSRDEAVTHLGTIAKSGTREFFQKLTGDQARDAHLIGQFGVGFYSSFIIADRVTVTSLRAGLPKDQAVRWESGGEGDFSVEQVEKEMRGTEIVLHLREGEDEFLSGWRLKSIIKKYSDHIALPIRMKKEEWKDGAETKSDEEETVNQASALWTRPKAEISDEQYEEFYKHIAHDFEPPLCWTHSKVEGRQEYTQLLYIPGHAPFDLWDRDAKRGLKLYVRRIFIMDDAEQLLPTYLRFMRGIVDSNDLPLNVSREILQESRDIEAIRGGCAKRALGMLEDLAANQPEKYENFWKEFGRVLKEGAGEDLANKERIARLMRFASTHRDTPEECVSLADYVARMKEGQEKIYYITADSFIAAQHSPHLEIFRKKGIEVLLLSDRVDEWVVGFLNEFDGKSLQSVAKGGLDLGALEDTEDKADDEKHADENKAMLEKIRESLGERVREVRITHRLTDSPSCLVADAHDPSANLARILKASGQKMPEFRPILEINPRHPAVLHLREREAANAPAAHFSEWANLFFEQAVLAEGGALDDPAGFVKRVNTLMLELSGIGKGAAKE